MLDTNDTGRCARCGVTGTPLQDSQCRDCATASHYHAGPQPWAVDALCAQVGTEVFYPGQGESAAPAKRVCAACPVRVECLTYALDNHEQHGIWGGLSIRERYRARRDQPATTAA